MGDFRWIFEWFDIKNINDYKAAYLCKQTCFIVTSEFVELVLVETVNIGYISISWER